MCLCDFSISPIRTVAPRQSKRYIAYSVFFASVLKTVSSSYHICAS
nr:MAG TPA: hypothetical protein [Caudoviricetes sp.]DAY19541.1 MAG TPA: hypothetical protein [Caudoviricetes sp.]